MDKGIGLLKMFSWDFFGRIGKQFIGFGIGIYLARMLGPSEFGLISLSMVFISIFSYFISTGLFASLVQQKNIEEKHLSSVFYFNIVVAILLTILLYVFAPLLVSYLDEQDKLINVIRVLILLFIVSAFTQVQESILRRKLQFKILAQSTLYSTLISGIVGVILAWKGFGIWSLVIQTILDRLVQTIFFWIKSQWRPKLLFQYSAIKELWPYGLNMFLIGLLENLVAHIDTLIISKKFGTTELGLFSRAKTLNSFAFRYSSESIGSVMFPTLAKLQNDKNKMINLGLKSEMMIAFVSFGILGWLYLNAENIITLLLGLKWISTIYIFKLLILSGFSQPMNSATSIMLRAAGFSRVTLYLELIKKGVYLFCIFIGFTFGMKGFLISLIFAGVFNLVVNILVTNKFFGTNFFAHIKNLIIPYCLSFVSVVIVCFLDLYVTTKIASLIFVTILFPSIYILLNLFFHTSAFMASKSLLSKFSLIQRNY